MHWIEGFDLFLFDLDGLLVDTEHLHYEAYQILCNRYDYELPWDFLGYLGVAHQSAEGLRNALYPTFKEKGCDWSDLYVEKKQIYQDLLIGGNLSLMPGVEALLKELANAHIKRCVVTNSTKEQVDTVRHFLPILKTIPVWITREDYKMPKPAPDGYLRAIEVLADPGDRIIGFEDSLRGLRSLQGTCAFPVLICDPAHPQLKEKNLKEICRYSSFTKIPKTFSKSL